MSEELTGVKKFQWSKMSPDRSEQIVIRTDNKDEFSQLIDEGRGLLPTTKPFPDDEGNKAHTPEQTQPEGSVCPVHKKQWTMGKFGLFCTTKNDDGTWCKQKPRK